MKKVSSPYLAVPSVRDRLASLAASVRSAHQRRDFVSRNRLVREHDALAVAALSERAYARS